MSQIELARDAGISTKHLGCLENGRARPSRGVVLRLAECLEVPLRIRNIMLASAGFEPVFQQRGLHDPALAAAWRDVEAVLAGFDPNPAMAVDRHWTMLSANKAVAHLVAGAEPMLLRPPVNLLRLCLHPAGLASRVVNLAEWRVHVTTRLRRQIEASGDTGLMGLLEEIRDYPTLPGAGSSSTRAFGSSLCGAGSSVTPMHAGSGSADLLGIAVPFQLATIDGTLSFFSTTTRFGSPADITLSELVIEAFLPADPQTSEIVRRNAQRALTPGPRLPPMVSRGTEGRLAECHRVVVPA